MRLFYVYDREQCIRLVALRQIKIMERMLTHSTMSVFRYDGIALTTGLPVKINTLSSGICANVFTINMSSMRLFDRSSTDTVLQSASACSESSELRKLFARFSEVRHGRIDVSQLSTHLMLLCDRFSVSKLMQHWRFSILFRAKSCERKHSNLRYLGATRIIRSTLRSQYPDKVILKK